MVKKPLRILGYLLLTAFAFALPGCVSEDDYNTLSEERLVILRDLQDLYGEAGSRDLKLRPALGIVKDYIRQSQAPDTYQSRDPYNLFFLFDRLKRNGFLDLLSEVNPGESPLLYHEIQSYLELSRASDRGL